MDERRAAYLAGDRVEDVAMFLASDAVDDPDRLANQDGGERVDTGAIVVVDGERGRRAFAAAAGTDPMSFAGRARGTESHVDRDLTGGTCPDVDGEDGENGEADHRLRFLFSFAEAHQPDGQGIYAEGDVIHAYAQCSCGVAYSDRWVVDADSESGD